MGFTNSVLATPFRRPLRRLWRDRPALAHFIAIHAADELCSQMLNVAIGWYVYAVTHNPISLAYVGLARFLPNAGLALIAGHAADRFDRRKVIGIAFLVQAVCLTAFCASSIVTPPPPASVYLLLAVIGSARAFSSPALPAMLPHTVSCEEFPRAVAATSSVAQICTLAGPAVGGLIYAVNGSAVFAATACLCFFAARQTPRLTRGRGQGDGREIDSASQGALAGIRYVRSNRLLQALLSLDLFAVLLGGVTALLPIYARDILRSGPIGLGCLRCAPGLGAAMIGILLAHRTIERGAGKLMLACVAGFGIATIVFALSANIWLSFCSLAVAGGFDMVSMVIRQTLVQISTPDAMRGRVSAVNGVFVGASSELGEFESGATAALFGAVPAALLGGVGTLLAVALWARLFPELRGAGKLVT